MDFRDNSYMYGINHFVFNQFYGDKMLKYVSTINDDLSWFFCIKTKPSSVTIIVFI